MTMNDTSPTSLADGAARENWARYLYGKDRGHVDYLPHAARCEDMYLGGGRQITPEQRAALIAARRPGYEFNQIKPSVNAAIGYQIHNRMDIAFKPRGGDADLFKATVLSKVTMQVADPGVQRRSDPATRLLRRADVLRREHQGRDHRQRPGPAGRDPRPRRQEL